MQQTINHVLIENYKPHQKHRQVREESARLWNRIVQLHLFIRKRSLQNPKKCCWPTESSFEKHFKGKFKLHSQTIQALIQKFFANLKSAQENRKSNKKSRYPHKYKYVFNPLFKKSAFNVLKASEGRTRLRVSLSKKNYAWFTIPAFEGELVQVELGFNRLFLTIQQSIEVPVLTEKKVAAIDLGLIHTAVITDGVNSQGIVGRGIRSIKQGNSKTLARLSKKQSRCERGSRRWSRLQHRKRLLISKKENRLKNAFHQVSSQLLQRRLSNLLRTSYALAWRVCQRSPPKQPSL